MGKRLSEFRSYRERMNEKILGAGNLEINRFFALDDRTSSHRTAPTTP